MPAPTAPNTTTQVNNDQYDQCLKDAKVALEVAMQLARVNPDVLPGGRDTLARMLAAFRQAMESIALCS